MAAAARAAAVSGATADRRTIAIAGGGPVGLAVAALLGAGPRADELDIRLFESRERPAWNADRVDLRVYALSRASQHVLEHAGAWGRIVAARASPYRRMHVWQDAHDARLGSLSFDCAEVGEPDLGHIVEDSLLRVELVDALQRTGAVLRFGVELTAVTVTQRHVDITTSTGETLTAAALIAADGAASAVRRLVDMPLSVVSYRQRAVVTHVATEREHTETAWQRFLPGGPLAFLPLVDGRSSVVWSTGTEAAARLCELGEAAFRAELHSASGDVLGALGAVAERISFPLQAAHARRYCRDRVALVGDAAHTVHPLAGQGMNLGLLDAAVLADVLLRALAQGEDPGELRVLRRYERQRKGDNLKALLALDALHRLFGVGGALVPALRAIGLSAVDAAPFAKTLLVRQALGLRGALPPAARARVA